MIIFLGLPLPGFSTKSLVVERSFQEAWPAVFLCYAFWVGNNFISLVHVNLKTLGLYG